MRGISFELPEAGDYTVTWSRRKKAEGETEPSVLQMIPGPSLHIEEAKKEITQNRNTCYAPEVVDACMRLIKKYNNNKKGTQKDALFRR